MRSFSGAWNTLLTKLGFSNRRVRRRRSYNQTRKLHFERCEDRQMLAVFTVNSIGDNTIGGDGLTTLREAINEADETVAADTIRFDSSLVDAVITLMEGQLSITRPVEITGTDASGNVLNITIDASGNDSTPDAARSRPDRRELVHLKSQLPAERCTKSQAPALAN
jgi:hypothetical protein